MVGSNINHKYNARIKFDNEENTATYLEFFSIFFWLPFVVKINNAPISGIRIIADKIGKFIV